MEDFRKYSFASISKVEKVEEFEPGQESYKEVFENLKGCQARVYFLYARLVLNIYTRNIDENIFIPARKMLIPYSRRLQSRI